MLAPDVLADLRLRLLAAAVEVVVVVPLWPERAGEPVLLSMGTRTSVPLDPVAVLGCVLRAGATTYALVHTHVDELPPSAADLAVTRRLVAASAACGLRLVAHWVLTPSAMYDCLNPMLPCVA